MKRYVTEFCIKFCEFITLYKFPVFFYSLIMLVFVAIDPGTGERVKELADGCKEP